MSRARPIRSCLAGAWLLACLAGPACAPAAPARLAAGAPLPNIVFIVIDSLRGDRLGTAGYTYELTPAMDLLATEGVLFERASSPAPWTLPSMASIFSGVHPEVHGVNDLSLTPGASVTRLADEFVTLTEILQARGYETAAFVANGILSPRFGFAQGFDHYDISMASNTTPGTRLNQAALRWLDARKSPEPFLLYLHYMDVHWPYTNDPDYVMPRLEALSGETGLRLIEVDPPACLKNGLHWVRDARKHADLAIYQEYWHARYDAGVRLIDDVIAELRQGLEQRGVFEQAYTILTSDHGEALQEHDLWDHGHSVHETDMHVPLILRWPGVLARGQRIGQRISLIDLLPTLVDQLGAREDPDVQGFSLFPLLSGKQMTREPVFGEGVRGAPDQKAIYLDRWKLIERSPYGSSAQLYDLLRDPGEYDNQAKERVPLAAGLLERIQGQGQRNAQRAHGVERPQTSLSEEERARLEALGYVN